MKNQSKFAIIAITSVMHSMLLSAAVNAATFEQVRATWSGEGAEPGIKEFADIACISKGFTRATDFDANPSSGAFEEDGKIVSYMDFAKIDCQ